MAGYSGKPLADKLGLRSGMRAASINAPGEYAAWLAPVPAPPLLDAMQPPPQGLEFLHLFTTGRKELLCVLQNTRHTLAPAGMVWVSWPKKAARIATEVTEDAVRELALPLGFVDVKICAVSEIWSGVKLMIRRELR